MGELGQIHKCNKVDFEHRVAIAQDGCVNNSMKEGIMTLVQKLGAAKPRRVTWCCGAKTTKNHYWYII